MHWKSIFALTYFFFFSAKNASRLVSNTVHVPVREKARLHQSGTVLPTVDWQNKQVSDFSKVRMKLARHTAYIQKHRGSEDRKHKLPSKTNEQGKIKRNPISSDG